MQAARQTGCAAIHPGWGFLAENPRMAALAAQHGVVFVGPTPSVMERMAKKLPAKAAMRGAGLEPIPGSPGLVHDIDEALAEAASAGYPVMLKADAGGGGRGIRICRDEGELRTAFPAATAEAQAGFGDGGLYLERYVEGGRHVEVQVLADHYGHAIHLGERECSIQRGHQKLIEESPSPALDDAQRKELGERAATAAAAIGYRGAGTVEFLMQPDGELRFMEMNTRLQVEHPVTECITGVDIVKLQLEIAAGQRLELTQADVNLSGHAIECRINAEDPADGFRPGPGRIEAFKLEPVGEGGRLRVDTHVAAGDEVTPYYDSLLAKAIAWAPTRDEAIEALIAALQAAEVRGVPTTIPMHVAVLDSPEFRSGDYDTRRIPGWSLAEAAAED